MSSKDKARLQAFGDILARAATFEMLLIAHLAMHGIVASGSSNAILHGWRQSNKGEQ